MDNYRSAATTFGAFFIVAFLTYGIGSALIASVANAPDFLSVVQAQSGTIILGVILIALIHTFVNIGLPVVMFPILSRFNRTLAVGYLSAAIAATTVAVVGAIFSLLLLPLSAEYVQAGSAAASHYGSIGNLLVRAGEYAYYVSMAIWGIGGLLFVSVLYISKLVPRFFPVWGLVGYAVFIAGMVFELFGVGVGLYLSLPGGLFEIGLSLLLIFKGFSKPGLEAMARVAPA
jgi:hypothetical protein